MGWPCSDPGVSKALISLIPIALEKSAFLFLSIFAWRESCLSGTAIPGLMYPPASCESRALKQLAAECPSRLSPPLALARPSLHEQKHENSNQTDIIFFSKCGSQVNRAPYGLFSGGFVAKSFIFRLDFCQPHDIKLLCLKNKNKRRLL